MTSNRQDEITIQIQNILNSNLTQEEKENALTKIEKSDKSGNYKEIFENANQLNYGMISKQEFDEVKYKFDEAALRVQAAEIAILNADDHLKKAVLKAPFDGVIASKNVELGESASPLQPAFVLNSEEAKILIAIDEKYANLVKVGDTFKFKLDAMSEQKELKIALIHPEIKRETRKFYAEAYDSGLKPGMFGQGKVIIGENK